MKRRSLSFVLALTMVLSICATNLQTGEGTSYDSAKTEEQNTVETVTEPETEQAESETAAKMVAEAEEYAEDAVYYSDEPEPVVDVSDSAEAEEECDIEITEIVVGVNDVKDSDRDKITGVIGDYAILEFQSEDAANEAYQSYQDNDATFVEMPGIMHIMDTGEEDYTSLNWGYGKIQSKVFNQALLTKYGSVDKIPSVKVAVIDSGVDYTHTFLADRVTKHDVDLVGDDEDAMDENCHGTHVAGIIADSTLANVEIYAYRVMDAAGYGSTADVAKAISQAVDDGVDVINLSLGGSGTTEVLTAALQKAVDANVVVVCAAGNDSADCADYEPANFKEAITVAASVSNDSIADYSNYGEYVDVTAPGSSIKSSLLNNAYGSLSGTSMAAPFVAGAAASLAAYLGNDNYTYAEIASVLEKSADDICVPGPDKNSGYGRINMSNLANLVSLGEWQGITEAPTLTSTSNEDGTITVTMSCETENATIYYTTDNTLPTSDGSNTATLTYSGPLALDKSTKILAVAKAGEKCESNSVSQKYYIEGTVLDSDFEVSSAGVLTAYYGSEQVLHIPDEANGITITTIGRFFGENCGAVELYISDTVTILQNYAFWSGKFETIHIGKNVANIGDLVFYNDESLRTLTVDEGNSNFVMDGNALYTKNYEDLVYIVKNSATEYQVRSECKRIWKGTFKKKIGITKAYLPATVVDFQWSNNAPSFDVQDNAVAYEVDAANETYCSENGVLYSKDKTILYAYPRCDSSESFTIPDTVTTIHKYAFYYSSLWEVTFPEGLLKLEDYAFYGCKINKYEIPQSVNYIGDYGLCNDGGTVYLYFDGNAPSAYMSNVLNGSKSVIIYRYAEATGFETYENYYTIRTRTDGCEEEIEEGIASDFTISDDGMITKYSGSAIRLRIPEKINGITVSRLGAHSISGGALEEIYIPDTVTTIEKEAFYKAHSLQKIHLGVGVATVGSVPFYACEKIREITVDSANENFVADEHALYTKDYKELVFAFYTSVGGEITINEACTGIWQNAFQNCAKCTVKIPASVSQVNVNSYYLNTWLNDVRYEVDEENETFASQDGILFSKDKTELIAYPSFYTAVEYILPDTIKKVHVMAFEDSAICSFTIPASVTYLDYEAFNSNVDEITLIFDGNAPSGSFAIVGETETKLYRYINATGFERYASQSNITICDREGVMPEDPTEPEEPTEPSEPEEPSDSDFTITPEGVLTGYSGNNTVLYIPETINGITVTTIGSDFSSDNRATEIYIPDTVTTLEHDAIDGMEKVHIGAGLKNVECASFEFNGEEITIDEKNPYFVTDGNGIYSTGYEDLIGLYGLEEGEKYQIKDTCKRVWGGFAEETWLATIVVPASVEDINYIKYFDASDWKILSEKDIAVLKAMSGANYEVAEENPYYASENGSLFNKAKTILYSWASSDSEDPGVSCTVPDTVQEIRPFAFWTVCVDELTLPEGLLTIDDFGLYEIYATDLIIPSTVQKIGYSAIVSEEDDINLYFEGNAPAEMDVMFAYFSGDIQVYKHSGATGFDTMVQNPDTYIVFDDSYEAACTIAVHDYSTKIALTIPEGYDTSLVYLDGVEYATSYDEASGTYVVDPSVDTVKAITAFELNAGGAPIGMYAWTVDYHIAYYEVTAHPELEDIIGYKGFSIRIRGYSGMRYTSTISQTTKAALFSEDGYYGFKLKEYGVIALPASRMSTTPLVVGGKSVMGAVDYPYTNSSGQVTENILRSLNGYDDFTGLLSPMKESLYQTKIAFRAYIVLEKDGVTYTFYQKPVAKDMYSLAKTFAAKYSPGTEEYEYLQNIINTVEGGAGNE